MPVTYNDILRTLLPKSFQYFMKLCSLHPMQGVPPDINMLIKIVFIQHANCVRDAIL